MGRMISPSGSHGRRLHGSLRILALVAVTLACPIATTSDAGANDDLKKPLASREVPSQSATAEHGASVQVRVSDSYGKLPLSFEANQGQTDPQVKFLSRSTRHTLFLKSTEAVLGLHQARQARSLLRDRSVASAVLLTAGGVGKNRAALHSCA